MGQSVEVRRVLGQAQTVEELIEELQQLDGKAKVVFTCSYGDISKTQQVLAVSAIDEYTVNSLETSGYSESGVALNQELEDTEASETVVVLS